MENETKVTKKMTIASEHNEEECGDCPMADTGEHAGVQGVQKDCYMEVEEALREHYARLMSCYTKKANACREIMSTLPFRKYWPIPEDHPKYVLDDFEVVYEWSAKTWDDETQKANIVLEKCLKRLEAANAAGTILEAMIKVKRTPRRTWGCRPKAECWVALEDRDGNVKTYHAKSPVVKDTEPGFDMRSSAVQIAIDRLDGDVKAAFDRLAIEVGAEKWKNNILYWNGDWDANPFLYFSLEGKGMGWLSHIFHGPKRGTNDQGNCTMTGYVINARESDEKGVDKYHIFRNGLERLMFKRKFSR